MVREAEFEAVYRELIKVAQSGGLTHYTDIAPLAGLNMRDAEHRGRIGKLLGDLSRRERVNGRPLLSAVVVSYGRKIPGAGFFNMAQEIGAYDGNNPVRFWEEELQRVYGYWAAHPATPTAATTREAPILPEQEVIYEIKGGIAYITLNRPEKLNAINPEMRELLWDAFQDVQHNPEVRCAIVTGRGRAFSTGHDLVAMANARANEGPSTGDLYVVQSHIWKPIIAAINGVCLAQGCGIALGSDIRIASREAQFGWPQAKRGIASVSGPALLSQVVPRNIAFEFLFTGEFVDAQKALELMLVNYVVEPEEVLPRAEEMAQKIVANAPLSLAAIKEASIKGAEMGLEERVAFAQAKRDEVLQSEDAKEGVAAFAEKRAPVWKGR